MRYRLVAPLIAYALCIACAASSVAGGQANDAGQLATTIARQLSAMCPMAPKNDVPAHEKCVAGLRDATFIPWSREGILFGTERADLPLSRWPLTHFSPGIWQVMYLSLFTFTGHWSLEQDDGRQTRVIRIEAYFRNALPAGEFPYPFWHSAAKWNDYEMANELDFHLNANGEVFVVVRSRGGRETNRGPFAHVTPPAFNGHWQWTDASGDQLPRASLFSSNYSAANPFLPPLDEAYRSFAIEARKAGCQECHAPDNKMGMAHLVLLQTPMHAAGEIDRVLKEVGTGEMPQNELGLREPIDPGLRAAILRTGESFRRALHEADAWEAERRRSDIRPGG